MPSKPHFRRQRRRPVSRRGFLAVGGMAMVGLSMAERAAVAKAQERSGPRSVILVVMNGGPSQLETFDPKPDAPSHVRGPLRSIATKIPGVHLSEGFPRLARRADRFTIVRSLHHDAAPIHETGHQLLYAGRLPNRACQPASLGAAASRLLGPRGGAPAYVLLPGPVVDLGVRRELTAGSGWLGSEYAPHLLEQHAPSPDSTGGDAEPVEMPEPLIPEFASEPVEIREEYGETDFGLRLWQSARLVERGVRVVIVNLCPKLHGEVTWDAHAHKPSAPGTLFDYRDTIGPQFDRACAALLDDLDAGGLLSETLVICTGEFGRTPFLNAAGGREHWTQCWSALVAGGGVPEGAVIGATDARGRSIIDHPVSLSALVATAYASLRIDPRSSVTLGARAEPLLDVDAVSSLLA
ncbi:MAG: DUF1501 domain-containing protein [Planctomycetaceae bacterium]|nr:DUF1501 domain-containing protein [Planctomycetaceae bacterium]